MADAEIGTATWASTRQGQGDEVHVRTCRFEITGGPDAGKHFDVSAPVFLIGRGNADIALSDRGVSAMHCEIRLDERGYRLRDLSSTNGTWIHGMRIVEVYLAPGAKIRMGDTTLRFEPLADSVAMPLWQGSRFGNMVGASVAMRQTFELIDQIARTEATVLITGETGTGKELVAEAIHQRSPRARGPFVVLDCGAIPPQLVEDQLFGHDAGSFTGAIGGRAGVFEAAHGGTLFLDELGELPLEVQPKLLRAVETRTVRRIGSVKPVPCDLRLIAATNRDLEAEVNRGMFRADLFYRIAVARVRVPPLRERPDDLPPLVDHFLDELGRDSTRLPLGFLDWARKHPWPGNVRELRNLVERAVSAPAEWLTGGVARADEATPEMPIDPTVPFKEAKQRLVDVFERRYASALLAAHKGNISAAARAAGIDRMSLDKLLRRLDVRVPDEGE
jgi:two-component system, NtrC family, response regulator GlrR